MTVRVERSFDLDATPGAVWGFIADPEKRAGAISVVDSWDREGEETVWHIRLPIPLIRRTVAVRTREVEREEGERVAFVGESSVMRVRGEHEIEAIDGGTRLHNRFVVDGKVPGVERFFQGNLDDELDNLERELARDLGIEA